MYVSSDIQWQCSIWWHIIELSLIAVMATHGLTINTQDCQNATVDTKRDSRCVLDPIFMSRSQTLTNVVCVVIFCSFLGILSNYTLDISLAKRRHYYNTWLEIEMKITAIWLKITTTWLQITITRRLDVYNRVEICSLAVYYYYR